MDNALQMLSLARRAGKLAYGFDAVAGAIQTGRAALVLISAQAAGRTERNIRRIAGENGVPVTAVPYSSEDWFPVLGKAVAVLAVQRLHGDEGRAGQRVGHGGRHTAQK